MRWSARSLRRRPPIVSYCFRCRTSTCSTMRVVTLQTLQWKQISLSVNYCPISPVIEAMTKIMTTIKTDIKIEEMKQRANLSESFNLKLNEATLATNQPPTHKIIRASRARPAGSNSGIMHSIKEISAVRTAGRKVPAVQQIIGVRLLTPEESPGGEGPADAYGLDTFVLIPEHSSRIGRFCG